MRTIYSTVVCIIILLLCSESFCKASLSPGVKGGIAIANVDAEDPEGNDPFFELGLYTYDRYGVNGSIFLDIAATKWLSVIPGLGYVNRGFRPGREYSSSSSSGPSTTESWEITIMTDYVVIPVTFEAKPYRWKVRPVAIFGPEVGLLVNSQAQWPDALYDVEDDFNTVDFGLNFGGGLEVKIRRFMPFIQLTMYRGLTNMSKTSNTIKHACFSAQGGLKFNIPRAQ